MERPRHQQNEKPATESPDTTDVYHLVERRMNDLMDEIRAFTFEENPDPYSTERPLLDYVEQALRAFSEESGMGYAELVDSTMQYIIRDRTISQPVFNTLMYGERTLATGLSNADAIAVGAHLTQDPAMYEATYALNPRITSDFVRYAYTYVQYQHDLWRANLDDFVEQLQVTSVSDAIDRLDYIRSLIEHALNIDTEEPNSVYTSEYVNAAIEVARSFMYHASTARPEPLVQIASRAFQRRFDEPMDEQREDQKKEFLYDTRSTRMQGDRLHVEESNQLLTDHTFSPTLADNDTVRRIAPGVVGIFDVSGQLQSVGDIVTSGEITHTTLQNILTDSKWNPFANTLDKNMLLLLRHLFHPDIEQEMEEQLGIDLQQIPFRAQIHLLPYIASMNTTDLFQLYESVHTKEGLDTQAVFESFIALAEDPSIVQELVPYIQDAPVESVNQVFEQYNAITAQIDTLESMVAQEITTDNTVDIRAVSAQLIQRANRVLRELLAEEDPATVTTRLERVRSDMIQFTALCAETIKRDTSIGIEALTNLSYETISGVEIQADSDLTDALLSTTKLNYNTQKHIAYTALELLLRPGDDSAQQDQLHRNTFHILRRDGDVYAFLRVEQTLDPETVFIGSFNTHPSARSGGVGTVMLAEVHAALKNRFNIEGTVSIDEAAGSYYVEQEGQIIVGLEVLNDKKNSDVPSLPVFRLRMEKEPKPSRLRELQPGDQAQLQQMLELQSEQYPTLEDAVGKEDVIIAYLDKSDPAEFQRRAAALLNGTAPDSYRATRYICLDGRACQQVLLGLERVE